MSGQETTRTKRALQEEHGANTNETAEDIRREDTSSETICNGPIRLGVPECYTSQGGKERT